MKHKIRLGPIAIFLAVIAAVLATLAMLTVATSRADAVLAERFASVTAIRYELEAEGNRFLQAAERNDASGLPEWTEQLENGNLLYSAEREGYTLTVEAAPDAAAPGTYQVVTWKITKIWESDDPFEDLWLG